MARGRLSSALVLVAVASLALKSITEVFVAPLSRRRNLGGNLPNLPNDSPEMAGHYVYIYML